MRGIMDIGSIDSNVSQLLSQAQNEKSYKVEQELKKDYSNSTDEELMDACKQFEAYMLEQVFKEMEKTIPKNEEEEDGPNGQLVDYFKGSMVQELTAQATENNSLGIAQALFEQMKRNYSI